jgi:WD40 repeat protein
VFDVAPLAVAYSPEGAAVAAGREDGAVVLHAGSAETRTTLNGHTDAVLAVAFSPDGKILASVSSDRTIRLWDPIADKAIAELKGHTGWVYGLAWSSDGKMLATGSYDKTVRLWDAEGKELAVLKGHKSGVRAVAFSPDDKTLASAGSDGKVRLWDVAKRGAGHPRRTQRPGACRRLQPRRQLLASAGDDGVIRLWDVETGKRQSELRGHADAVTALAFARGKDAGLRRPRRECAIVDPSASSRGRLSAHADGVRGVAWSPDGTTLASAGGDKAVSLWRTPIRPQLVLQGHRGPKARCRRLARRQASPVGEWLAQGGCHAAVVGPSSAARKSASSRGRRGSGRGLQPRWQACRVGRG